MRPPTARALVAFLAPLLVTPGGCGPASAPAPARNEPSASVPRVAVTTPERAAIRREVSQPGQIEALETTGIHAKLAGYVSQVAVDIGDRVTSGQVLAELDVPEMVAERAQKQAMVEQAEADRAQAEAAVAVAEAGIASARARQDEVRASIRRTDADVARWRAEYERIAQLVRESAVTGSLRDETRSKLQAAEAARDEAQAQARSAESAVAEAEAALAKARADVTAAAARVDVARAEARRVEALLSYTRITSPFDGVVTRRGVDTGHLTVPGGAGEPLFVVARTDRVRVSVGVPETDAPSVEPGDPATVRVQALGGRAFEGAVARTSYALDAATRTLRAEVDLANPDGLLRPGLYAYATLVADDHPDTLTIPRAALVREGGRSFCVVVADGRARRLPIQVGLADATRVEVLSGLDGGESVVAAHAESLADGQPVAVAEPEAANAKP